MLSASGSDIEKTLWRMPANEKIDRADLDLFSARNREFRNNAIQNAEPFGPPHMETNCGFKLRGAVVTGCAAHNVVVQRQIKCASHIGRHEYDSS